MKVHCLFLIFLVVIMFVGFLFNLEEGVNFGDDMSSYEEIRDV